MPSFCTIAHHPRASTDPDIKEQGAAVGQGHRGDGEFRDGVEVKKKGFEKEERREPEGGERICFAAGTQGGAVTDAITSQRVPTS